MNEKPSYVVVLPDRLLWKTTYQDARVAVVFNMLEMIWGSSAVDLLVFT